MDKMSTLLKKQKDFQVNLGLKEQEKKKNTYIKVKEIMVNYCIKKIKIKVKRKIQLSKMKKYLNSCGQKSQMKIYICQIILITFAYKIYKFYQ